MTGADAAATMVATFVDEWVRAGITDAVVCPGSRSTPLTLAVLADDRLRAHVHVDERSAAFTALGLGLATGVPAPILTTSGTAAVELHPAVVEAHHAAVPLIACTADRPPELQGIGAPQTIDQRGLFGSAVRASWDVAPAEDRQQGQWRSWASQAVLAATGDPPGPVHLNLGFREPLLGPVGPLPPGRPAGSPWHRRAEPADPPDLRELLRLVRGAADGIVVAGRGCGGAPSVLELADRLGWAVLADPLSGLRIDHPGVVCAFDPLLRDPTWASAAAVPVALQLGADPASKALGAWLDASASARAVVAAGPEVPREGRDAPVVVRADPAEVAAALLADLPTRPPGAARTRWVGADRAAQAALDRTLAEELSEPGVARTVAAHLPPGGALVVASSMPVRDLEWFAGPVTPGTTVLANRGANGIDGVVSTAVGVALTGRPTAAIVGDLAFLHDTNGLLGAAGRDVDLTLVVVDNDGGGIFSFLPQAEALAPATFETAFGTPHGLDLVAVARAHGVEASRVTSAADLVRSVAGPEGLRVLVAPSDRAANVAVHDRLNRAVADAVGA